MGKDPFDRLRHIPMRVALGFVLTLFALSSFVPSVTLAATDKIEVLAGTLMKVSHSEYLIVKETTEIPLVSTKKDPGNLFGVIVVGKAGRKQVGHAVIDVPKADGSRKRTKSDKFNLSSTFNITIGLDEGDKPGRYTVEIYIEGKLHRKIDFTVR